MDFHAPPFDFELEFLLQLFDDAFADVAEGSDVVGKDLHAYGHESGLVVTFLADMRWSRSPAPAGSPQLAPERDQKAQLIVPT
jgi:hypothetical protein